MTKFEGHMIDQVKNSILKFNETLINRLKYMIQSQNENVLILCCGLIDTPTVNNSKDLV